MARRTKKHVPSTEALLGLPEALRKQLTSLLGEDVAALEDSLEHPAPVSIRLNPFKPFDTDLERIPWCANGRYLTERPAFTFDPLLHLGAYYVQEAASMLLEQAFAASGIAERDLLSLDLCAAPGGKSTHLLSLLSKGSLLVANEPDGARRWVLAENIWKQGTTKAVITASLPTVLADLPEEFDLILVDAPCSGEGMFRKDPFARAQWSPALVQQCARTQQDIVQHAWHALAPGGTLIYSTCTWEVEENEYQIAPLVAEGAVSIALPMAPAWGVVVNEIGGVIGHRCYPHRLRGEGFFLAVLRKPGELRQRSFQPANSTGVGLPWLATDQGLSTLEHNGLLHTVPERWLATVRRLMGTMAVLAPGTPFAERKGNEPSPHPAAALSSGLSTRELPTIDLNAQGALAYLRGEALPHREARGIALASYRGKPLGWLHGAGNRWNNRWPAPWRIRGQRSSAPAVPWSNG